MRSINGTAKGTDMATDTQRAQPTSSNEQHPAVEQRVDLARWLARIAETRTPVEGLVHHAPAAEAIYLPDPEGNTIELNWDPPREVWSRPGQPPFTGNLPLDTEGLFKLLEGQPS